MIVNVCLDIDKVMINLKTEEFVLDGPPLQSLQQLIQWVGDFVLYLLANLPNQVRYSQVPGNRKILNYNGLMFCMEHR